MESMALDGTPKVSFLNSTEIHSNDFYPTYVIFMIVLKLLLYNRVL
jgi:hypothetical protein